MKNYACACGTELFLPNTECAKCGRRVGWCDACGRLTSVGDDGRCENLECRQSVSRCLNRERYEVCNGLVIPENGSKGLCLSCRRTQIIPNVNVPGNVDRWRVLERAKRRLLVELAQLGFKDEVLDGPLPLLFEFKADTDDERVMTGHTDGVITINLDEADPVHREKARQQFGEPQRTIIGHLRHEFGHYWWQTQVQGKFDEEFRELFGDHTNPSYIDAMPRYYEQGPPADWRENYISQYASAHPWEDFAETAGFYQDAMAMLETLRTRMPAFAPPRHADFDEQLTSFMAAGIALNEITRTMGLIDVVPEVVSDPVIEKLRFVHRTTPAAQGAMVTAMASS